MSRKHHTKAVTQNITLHTRVKPRVFRTGELLREAFKWWLQLTMQSE